MKRVGGLALAILAISVLFGVWHESPVSAAACANTSSFGAVSLRVPTLAKKGDYLVWLRLQSTEPTGKVLLEVNNEECLEVGGSQQEGTWVWRTYQANGSNQTINFNHTEDNILKVIGIQSGVRLDRVLITESYCTPSDFGNNCVGAIEVSTGSDIQILAAPSEGPVQGKFIISNTPFTKSAELSRLSYSTEGRRIQTTAIAEPFDTTRLKNGKYTIIVETTLKDGEIIRESTVLTIENPENALSPVMRWLKSHQAILRNIGLAVAGACLLVILVGVARRLYKQNRERHFHGF